MSPTSKKSKPPEPSVESAADDFSVDSINVEEPPTIPPAAPTEQQAEPAQRPMYSIEHEACAEAAHNVMQVYARVRGYEGTPPREEAMLQRVDEVMRGKHHAEDSWDSEEHRQYGLFVRTVRSMATALGWSGPQ